MASYRGPSLAIDLVAGTPRRRAREWLPPADAGIDVERAAAGARPGKTQPVEEGRTAEKVDGAGPESGW